MALSAIITGDIVRSRHLEPKHRQILYEALLKFLHKLNEDKIIKKFEQYRGDSFQCEVKKPGYALRAALLIKCFVKAFPGDITSIGKPGKQKLLLKPLDVRLSIGIGNIDFVKKSLAVSDGQAFLFSGEGLDYLKNSNQQLYFKSNNEPLNDEIGTIIMLIDAIIQKYYSGQAEVILYKLMDWKEEEIARKLGITQSAINQRAKSAFWYAIETVVKKFEKQL